MKPLRAALVLGCLALPIAAVPERRPPGRPDRDMAAEARIVAACADAAAARPLPAGAIATRSEACLGLVLPHRGDPAHIAGRDA